MSNKSTLRASQSHSKLNPAPVAYPEKRETEGQSLVPSEPSFKSKVFAVPWWVEIKDNLLVSETAILPRITKYGDLRWGPKETQRLINNYRSKSKETLEKIFPDRTYVAIQGKANRMRIKKKPKYPPWSDEELCLLKTFQDSMLTFHEIADYFPSRTVSAVKLRFYKTGLEKSKKSYYRKPRWLDMDVNLLEQLYSDPMNSVKEIHTKLKGKHSVNALRLKVSRMGLKREWGEIPCI